MAVKTIRTGVLNDDTGVLVSSPNVMPPYLKGHVEYCEELIMGTAGEVAAGTAQFESGDSIVLEFEASTKIMSVLLTTNVGAIIPFTEADIGGTKIGKKLTTGVVTTNVKCRVVADA